MKRITVLRDQMKARDLDAVLVHSKYNRRYLSGFTGSNGYLYISQDQLKFLTDFRYIEQGKEQCPDFETVDYMAQGIEETLVAYCKEDQVKRLGFEGNLMTYSQYESFNQGLEAFDLVSMDRLVEEIREIKDEEELALIRQAAEIGDQAFSHICDFIKEGVTEREVALELEITMKRLGASGLSFDSIVASGTNGAKPHHEPTDKPIQAGELVTLDFGCIYQGYCSDMTRTLAIGEVSDELIKIYSTVFEAQKEGVEGLQAGLTGKEADALSRDVIEAAGYGQYFGHGLGHSLGLEVHENPRLSPKEDRELKANMLATIEPGIYVPGVGGVRIEDLVIIKENGIENLCHSNKKLMTL